MLIVEGENDLLSCIEAGWQHAILATIGNISGSQLLDLEQRFADWNVVTLFDRDEAGDGYRNKLSTLQLTSLTQYVLPEHGQDPDSALKQSGATFEALLIHCSQYQAASTPVVTAQATIRKLKADDYHRTDIGNADMLHDLLEGSVKYVAEHRDWAHFDGCTWRLRSTSAIHQAARLVANTRLTAAEAMPVATELDSSKKRKAMSFAFSCENVAKLSAMLSLASKDSRIVASAEDFDSDPYLLGVQNGIVNLKTGELIPAEKSLLVSKQCAANYDPTAQCPTWLKTLTAALTSEDDDVEEVLAYLQRVFGMALVGKVFERAFFFIYGKPGTGKSLTTNTIRRVLGDYAMELSPNSLMATNNPSNDVKNSEIAQLKGVRFALASEAEQGQRFNDGLIKRITGQDAIVVRELFERSFSMVP